MSEDGIKTITSSSAQSTDDNWTDVTGTDFGTDPNKKRLLDVAIKEGSVSSTPAGLTTGGLITVVALNAVTWTALPATPLVGRNGIGIQNESGTALKLNFATPGGYIGWTIADGGEFFVDITESILIFAKAAIGTPSVTIMEIA